MINKILIIFICITMAGIILITGYIRFTHPELTETQLFIEYWEIWISFIAVILAVVWILKETSHE